jgi:protein phosphatase
MEARSLPEGPLMFPRIVHACLSDRGLTHPGNEDRWFAGAAEGIYVVADGMADERPAQMIVERLPGLLRKKLGGHFELADPRTERQVQAAITVVSEQVRERMDGGSTLVLVLVRGHRALIVHLGDSRVYLFRKGTLEALTRDHSYVEEEVESGVLTRAEAARLRFNGGPTRFVGMWGEPEAGQRLLDLQPDDRLLLCSDGLTGMLADDDIAALLQAHAAPSDACARLVAAANAAGGKDNITALVLAVAADSPLTGDATSGINPALPTDSR